MEFLLMGLAQARADDCADPAALVADAEQLVLFADLDGARGALLRVESALGCSGPADPETLARFWLVEGALLLDSGALAGASTSFAAARRVAPAVWIVGLGPERRQAYDAAIPTPETGQLAIDAAPGASGEAWVDGVDAVSPLSVEAGEHLVQYGADGRAWFAQVVIVSADQQLHVKVPSRPAPPHPPMDPNDAIADQVLHVVTPTFASPAAPIANPTREPNTRPYAHLSVGADVSFGANASDVRRLLTPLEVGGGASGKRLWARAATSIAPVFIGELEYTDDRGDPQTSSFAAGAHLAAGASFGPLDLGMLGGYAWPERAVGQLVLGLAFPRAQVQLEARVGANVRPEESFEPAAGLVLAFPGTPAGGWRR